MTPIIYHDVLEPVDFTAMDYKGMFAAARETERSEWGIRGGYNNHSYDGYNSGMQYKMLHVIYGPAGNRLTVIPKSVDIYGLSAFADKVAYEASLKAMNSRVDVPTGEICVRIIRYPAQDKVVGGLHTDACFLTVPMYDSIRDWIAQPFYSEIAERYDMTRYVALRHAFKAMYDRARVYIVAFMQMPHATIMPDGRTSGEHVAEKLNRSTPYVD